MSECQTVRLDDGCPPEDFWRRVADTVHLWCEQQRVALRDAIVLVPFAQLIDPARRAFAAAGGWQPRVETTATWGSSMGPPPELPPGVVTGSPTLDALTAAQLLRGQPGLAAWERDDPRAFFQAVAAVVTTAQALSRAAQAYPAAERTGFWDGAVDRTGAVAPGPGTLELTLARLAVEWARMSPVLASDRLFDAAPGALIWVDAGGADPLATALARRLGRPALRIDADSAPDRVFEGAAAARAPGLIVAEGMEDEAHRVAGEVIDGLNAGLRPVALITVDRALVRRVRALLDRQAVVIADETGWALSTTRAAGCVMSLLRASSSHASYDETLEWLKSLPPERVAPEGLQQLERAWRAGDSAPPPTASGATTLLAWARASLLPLQARGRRSLASWLQVLRGALDATGACDVLAGDDAGRQVIAALHLDESSGHAPALMGALRAEALDRSGFVAWVDRTLEQATFVLPPVARPDVVLTPLPRAILRPFGAVVVGGADERQLVAAARYEGLMNEAAAAELGLDTPTTRRARECQALVHLSRVPRLTFTRRRQEGAEPVAASPALDALAWARRCAGREPWDERAPVAVTRYVQALPVSRPAPAAPDDLPPRLSASTLESLRACPYRFFARAVLGLREADELDEGVDKRDYGNWLHAVLDRFHRARHESASGDERLLQWAADTVSSEMALSPDRLLPFRIGFEWLVPAYLAWLSAREAQGQVWSEGELAVEREPAPLQGTRLFGRIDRIDRGAGRTSLIDYKTGSVSKLQAQLREPLEDTQLAFYALLMDADRDDRVEALYLALDDPKAPRELVHDDVAESARTLLAGLAEDLRRLRQGAGMAALGEGGICEHCESRGLCRRDHWSAPT